MATKLRNTLVYDSRSCLLIHFGKSFSICWWTETNWSCKSPGSTKPYKVNCDQANEKTSILLSDIDFALKVEPSYRRQTDRNSFLCI